MSKNFKESLCELYALPIGAPVGVYTEPLRTRSGMIVSTLWRSRIVFYAGGRLVSLRLNEEHFSNWPLQWVRHLGANRLIGYQANMLSFKHRSDAEQWALTGVPLDDFTHHYLIAALWSSSTHDGTPLDDIYDVDDIMPDVKAQAMLDCLDFQQANRALLKRYAACHVPHADAPNWQASAGHDFWLTRNGHGAGFWDRGMGALGDALTVAAKGYGGVDLVELGNGKIGA